MRDSHQLQPDNDYEGWLQEFDRLEIDASDRRAMWALRYHSRIEAALRRLRPLPRGARVLEVGASQANTSLLAAEAGLRAVALDRDTRALSYAWRKHQSGDFSTVCGDALKLPFLSGSFAAVLALEILEHLPDPLAALREARRVLAPGGIVVVTTPNADYATERLPSYAGRDETLEAREAPDASGHLFAFTLKELRAVVQEAGLAVVESRYEGSLAMSDKLPLKRLFTPRQLIGISHAMNKLPGASRVSYTCLVTAVAPVD